MVKMTSGVWVWGGVEKGLGRCLGPRADVTCGPSEPWCVSQGGLDSSWGGKRGKGGMGVGLGATLLLRKRGGTAWQTRCHTSGLPLHGQAVRKGVTVHWELGKRGGKGGGG